MWDGFLHLPWYSWVPIMLAVAWAAHRFSEAKRKRDEEIKGIAEDLELVLQKLEEMEARRLEMQEEADRIAVGMTTARDEAIRRARHQEPAPTTAEESAAELDRTRAQARERYEYFKRTGKRWTP
jgi:response regulator of citrate/malate metabolism